MEDSDRTLGSDRTFGAPNNAPKAPTIGPPPEDAPTTIPIGEVLAGRYQIIDLLGVGGMGAVYKVFDRQLTRVVALKTILAEMAATPVALKRFKQEVVLAQSIVHKNIVRIFDIGEDGATKFITMDFIEGVDLKHLIVQRGKLPPLEAASIIRQVCSGLEAAHAAGVVHRDLKPQNIMIEGNGHIVVMDFGIAGSGQSRGATQTGAFLGTPDYMSPEQAKTEQVDARSDIFSLGLIFYEMLTGKLPFQGKTVLETMFKRTTERAVAPVEIDPSVPKSANDIVIKCLQTEREQRYQSVTALLEDLETFDPTKKVGAAERARGRLRKAARYRNAGVAAVLVLVALVAGFMLRNRFALKPSAEHPPVTVLVADFNNATGDDVFTGTLETMSETALEEASFVNKYRRDQARRVLAQTQNGATKLDAKAAQLLAVREGIGVIVTGSVVAEGTGYQISVRAIDATGKVIATKEVSAAKKELVLASVGRLIAPIRTALGDTTPESAQVAAAETYTAGSLESAHAYAIGKEYEGSGKYSEAIRYYKQAVELDPNLGRAYLGLASTSITMKQQAEAKEYYNKVLALVDRMSEHEKLRTLGTYYTSFANNYEQAIETLLQLVRLYPADGVALNNLSSAYRHAGNVADALITIRRSLAISPNNLPRCYNYATLLNFTGDFTAADAEAQRCITLNPGYELSYLPLALSAGLRGDLGKATEVYGKLEKVSPSAASLSKMGQADLKMYSGHYREAQEILLSGIAVDEKEGNPGESAYKLVALAETYSALGRRADAVAAATKAGQASALADIQFLAARALIEAGEEKRTQGVVGDLEGRLQKEAKSFAQIIAGDIALKHNRLSESVAAYGDAQKTHDSWLSHLLLGKAYIQGGHFPEALRELETCDKLAGQASDVFDANTTTLRYLPELYYWLGRAHEGIGASEAARKSYQRYVSIREQANPPDKLLADAKNRLGH